MINQKELEKDILNEVLNCIAQRNPDAEKCTMYIMGVIDGHRKNQNQSEDQRIKDAIAFTLRFIENRLCDQMSNGIFNDFKNTQK